MPSPRPAIFLALACLLLAILACSLPGVAAPPDPTSIAATRISQAVSILETQTSLPNGGKPTPTLAPSPTPIPSITTSLDLVYLDGGHNLWGWREGKNPLQLTTSGDVDSIRLSPDGTRVAFVRLTAVHDYSLWVIQSDGSGERRLVAPEDFNRIGHVPDSAGGAPALFAWVPGVSATIVFTTRPVFDGMGMTLNDDLWTIDATGAAPVQKFPAGSGGHFFYSPDGKLIALLRPRSISLADAGGSNLSANVLSYPGVNTYSEYLYYPSAQWAPDSSYFLVAIPPAEPLAIPRLDTAIWKIPADGTHAVQLTHLQVSFTEAVKFSPDMNHMLYLRYAASGGENQRELHMSNVDGSNDALIATGEITDLLWAPDSQHFVFTLGFDGSAQLGTLGAGYTPLSDTGFAFQVLWLDAGRFVFGSHTGSKYEVRLGKPAAASTLIATLTSANESFAWTFDTR